MRGRCGRWLNWHALTEGSAISVQRVICADFGVLHFMKVMISILNDIPECTIVRSEAGADCATISLVSDKRVNGEWDHNGYMCGRCGLG